jgi:hypothetical protein
MTVFKGCGDLRYLDVDELEPGGADELQELLNVDASQSSSSVPAKPIQAYLVPQITQHDGGQSRPAQTSPMFVPNERCSLSSFTNFSRPAMEAPNPKYLIVCINTKRGLVIPHHIEVSSIANDQFLFEQINLAYLSVRRGHN